MNNNQNKPEPHIHEAQEREYRNSLVDEYAEVEPVRPGEPPTLMQRMRVRGWQKTP